MKTIKVKNIWYNDSGDVTIAWVAPIDETRELVNDLFWYSNSNRPDWHRGQELSDEEILKTKCYKQRKLESIDRDIPNDCYMAI